MYTSIFRDITVIFNRWNIFLFGFYSFTCVHNNMNLYKNPQSTRKLIGMKKRP